MTFNILIIQFKKGKVQYYQNISPSTIEKDFFNDNKQTFIFLLKNCNLYQTKDHLDKPNIFYDKDMNYIISTNKNKQELKDILCKELFKQVDNDILSFKKKIEQLNKKKETIKNE